MANSGPCRGDLRLDTCYLDSGGSPSREYNCDLFRWQCCYLPQSYHLQSPAHRKRRRLTKLVRVRELAWCLPAAAPKVARI